MFVLGSISLAVMNSNEWIRILALCLFVVAAARAEPASAAERPSLVQRLKLARESMLKGFNRKPAESGPAISVAVEDTSGTSDVVRQLTNDYSPEVVEVSGCIIQTPCPHSLSLCLPG